MPVGSTVAEACEDLTSEWDPENVRTPHEVNVSCKDPIKWICSVDSRHRWEATPNHRVYRMQGCPYCCKRKVDSTNSLESLRPDLAKEWDESNEKTPAEVSTGSAVRVRWRCENGHQWHNSVQKRAIRGQNCPHCRKVKSKAKIQDLTAIRLEKRARLFNEHLARSQARVKAEGIDAAIKGLLAELSTLLQENC